MVGEGLFFRGCNGNMAKFFLTLFNVKLNTMLEKGLKGQSVTQVTEQNTAKVMGSGDMDVFATPAMVALLENAAMNVVAKELDEDSTTVGALMNVSHVKPSKLGATITAEAELQSVEGRKLTFSVVASDEMGVIGEGTHIRYIVNRQKFMAKLG